MKIDIITDNSLIIPEYIIDLKNKSNKTIELVEHHEKLKNLEQQKVDDKFSGNKENKKFYKKKIIKKNSLKKILNNPSYR
jgi:ribonuclease E